MRGKPCPRSRKALHTGITPADAGKTPTICALFVFQPGSPPRMRGKQRGEADERVQPGITPADAGKTAYPPLYTANIWDHPRGCGENLRDWVARNAAAGSPPRMRGKRKTARAHSGRFGITPADAGKTPVLRNDLQNARDHPRGCGENADDFAACADQKGSPPRMRGKRFERYSGSQAERITPADAGKTCLTVTRAIGIWDHPRGCGENYQCAACILLP